MMENFELLRLIILFPLAGFISIFLFSRFMNKKTAAFIASASVFISFVLSLAAVKYLINSNSSYLTDTFFWWINRDFLNIPIRFYLDRLSSVMILVVSGVGFLIHIYSISYMSNDRDLKRFFSYLNLFVFFMLTLVLSDNLIITFFGWEGVGLSSYLLIGFWYENIENSKAAKKAFIVNRIGDAFFILGILIIHFMLSSAGINEISYSVTEKNVSYLLNSTFSGISSLDIITLMIFIGACGKSAQFPLYIWLPDAMAGPTPVSALIHAATMVTAGIYIVSRMFTIYSYSHTLEIIMFVAALTSFLAALIATGQRDIKKILAYSTISQLGYMFMGVAAGSYATGIFHLTTHAFFKALLFLSAGAVIHSLNGIQDIFMMGGLKDKIRSVFYTMLAGFLAISGFPYMSGYFSKDMIIESLYLSGNKFIWVISVITAFLTAFYMTRMFVTVFIKKSDYHHHIHNPDKIMIIPLIILALLSVFSGFFTDSFMRFLNQPQNHHHISFIVKHIPLIACFSGLFTGYILFIKNTEPGKNLFSRLIYNKFYVDEIYQYVIVKPVFLTAKYLFELIDRKIIDGFLVEGTAALFKRFSMISSKMENSDLTSYVSYILLGVSILLFIILKGVI